LALLHFFWIRSAKNNFAEVWVYTAIIAVLLVWRLTRTLSKKWLHVSNSLRFKL
jgi:sulfoxide reductase heme-binding subunit YedZ